MTTFVRYRSGDIVALAVKPEQAAGMVCQDQQPDKQHVKVFRTGQPAPELLRLEDITPWAGGNNASKPD